MQKIANKASGGKPVTGSSETVNADAILAAATPGYPQYKNRIDSPEIRGLYYALSSQIRALQQGVGNWEAGATYSKGSRALYAGQFYVYNSDTASLATQANKPGLGPAWDLIGPQQALIGMLVSKFHWMRDLSEIYPGTVWEDVTASLGYSGKCLVFEGPNTPGGGFSDQWQVPDFRGHYYARIRDPYAPAGGFTSSVSGIMSEGRERTERKWMAWMVVSGDIDLGSPRSIPGGYRVQRGSDSRVINGNSTAIEPFLVNEDLVSINAYSGHSGGGNEGLIFRHSTYKIMRLRSMQ